MEKVKSLKDCGVKTSLKRHNSSYFEELSGLLSYVASRINKGQYYYFDDKSCVNYSKEGQNEGFDMYYYFDDDAYLENLPGEPNSNYNKFIMQFNDSFNNRTGDEIHIIRGVAGIGKSLFFNKGLQMLLKNSSNTHDKYIPLCIDFKNIDQNENIAFYENYIYHNLIDCSIDAIEELGLKNFFAKEYINYTCGIETTNGKLFPLKYFCEKIFDKYKKPCIIVFDNIDLANVDTQIKVFSATAKICDKFNKLMTRNKAIDKYCIYFTMRPETYMHSEEAKLGRVINFPLPNVLSLSIRIIENALIDAAKKFDKDKNMICEIEYYDITKKTMTHASNYQDIAVYFINILHYYLEDIWSSKSVTNRVGNCEDFHCHIVNYNIRTFLSFFADTISNGGFLPLTEDFNQSSYPKIYTVYDYIEMVIRGRWYVHPGNTFIDGEGSNKSPMVFNVFDISLLDNHQENIIKHFMIYVRILQYFSLYRRDRVIKFSDIKKKMLYFFNEDNISNAMKILTFVRFIYSFSEGEENIASKKSWTEVEINLETEFKLSPCGKFYIEKLICEFEYVYQMSISSVMLSSKADELLKNNLWNKNKELTVLYFLQTIFTILQSNLNNYNSEAIIEFKALFCQDEEYICKPFRRMLESFISVMKSKYERAVEYNSSKVQELNNIYDDALTLKQEVDKYFFSKLGDLA